MPTYLAPGLYYEQVDADATALAAVRTDVPAFIGVAERGPLHSPAPVNSWEQFQSRFGNFIPQAFLAYAVNAFFENGGDRCHVVRVAGKAYATAADTTVLQPADGTSSMVLVIDGFVPGAAVTVRQDPDLQGDYLLTAVDEASKRLSWDRPLIPRFQPNAPGKPLRFETGASAASGILPDAAGKPTLSVAAGSPGIWGNTVEVRSELTWPAATRTAVSPPQPADRLSSIVDSLTGFQPFSLVHVYQPHAPAPVELWQYAAGVDPVYSRILWDTALPAAFDLAKPIYFETVAFTLTAVVQGRIEEIFTGLSLNPKHDRYAPSALQASNWIAAADLSSPSAPPKNLPAPAAVCLRAGRDGIAALQLTDLTGDLGSATRTGLRTLELDSEPFSVALPDLMMQPVPASVFAPVPVPANPCLPGAPPATPQSLDPVIHEQSHVFSLDEVARGQQAMASHCEAYRYRFAVLDPPVFPNVPALAEPRQMLQWRLRFDTEFAALYFPWTIVYDPIRTGNRITRAIPPCGHVLGTYAAVDLDLGVHAAPANRELAWIQDLAYSVDANLQGVLNPQAIDCIRTFPGRGQRVYGARTLSSSTLWQFVNVRRLMSMIEKSVEIAVQWSVFEPNDAGLRHTLAAAIANFLEAMFEAGAFAGATAADSFYVKCDASNNTGEMAGAGQLLCEVGVAPAIPAEFVVFRVGRTRDKLEITES